MARFVVLLVMCVCVVSVCGDLLGRDSGGTDVSGAPGESEGPGRPDGPGGRLVEHIIRDEYIIVMKKLRSAIADKISSIRERLKDFFQQHPVLQMVKEMAFKTRSFGRLRCNDTRIIDLLKNSPLVEFIEKHKKVKLIDPDRFNPQNLTDDVTGDDDPVTLGNRKRRSAPAASCEGRVLGENGWGSTRSSYRAIPDYRTAPYRYSRHDDGSDVRIYIVDSGIMLDHADFSGRAVAGFVGSDVRGEGPDDLNGHGTNVAGIAGGDRFGMAPGATLVSVKVIGEDGFASTGDIVEALQWIVGDVRGESSRRGKQARAVVNMSLGGPGSLRSIEYGIDTAVEENIPVVVAAGNDAADACAYTPAKVTSAITVGATDQSDSLASFSNWGRCVDILAPGVRIAGPYPGAGWFSWSRNQYKYLSGTSQAAPHVTGAVARYISSLSDDVMSKATPAAIEDLAVSTATKNHVVMPPSAPNTPNALLHKECVPNQVDINIFEFDPTGNETPASGSDVITPCITRACACLLMVKTFLM